MKIHLSTLLLLGAIGWFAFTLARGSTKPVVPAPLRLSSESAVTVALATKEYQAGMSELYRKVASQIEAGEITTVTDFAKAIYGRNQQLRQAERQQLESLMQKRLGDQELDRESAAAFLREMAAVYERAH